MRSATAVSPVTLSAEQNSVSGATAALPLEAPQRR